MPGSDPQTGDVYYYPYLWKRQGSHSEPEKDRPCCIAVRLTHGRLRGADVILLAVTKSGYPEGGYGREIPPELVAQLKRLDSSTPTYLIMSEFNSDTSDQPSFEGCEFLGTLPTEFMKKVLEELREHLMNGSGEVNRTGTG